jgi:hypothetical protein
MKFLAALLGLLACVGVAFAEEAQVSDGLTLDTYLQNGVGFNNIEQSTYKTNAFSTNGTSTVTVTWTSHGKSINNVFSIEDGPTIDGLNMNGAWFIASVPNANTFTFTHTGTASGTTAGPTGNAVFSFTAWGDDGKLRFQCYVSHLNYDDPIKYPGTRSAAHLHQFLGNTLTDYTSTYASLRGAGDGSCNGGALNRTAYWTPVMLVSSGTQVLIPGFMTWYYIRANRRQLAEYRSPICDQPPGSKKLQDGRDAACSENGPYFVNQQPVRRLLRGTKAIFGYDPGLNGGEGGFHPNAGVTFLWSCQNTGGAQQGGNYAYLHNRDTAALGLTSNVSCPSDGKIQIRASSPMCWDGELDSSNHYTHFAHHGNDGYGGAGGGNNVCPASHPYPHLVFEILMHWDYSGGFAQVANWWLSSDRHNGADFEAGETWHWDMLFAWNDTIMDFWAKHIMGMYPNTSSLVTDRIYQDLGNPANNGEGLQNHTGGMHVRNMNDGGLGVANITPCTTELSATSAACALLDYRNLPNTAPEELSGDLIAIPSQIPGGRKAGKRRFSWSHSRLLPSLSLLLN